MDLGLQQGEGNRKAEGVHRTQRLDPSQEHAYTSTRGVPNFFPFGGSGLKEQKHEGFGGG